MLGTSAHEVRERAHDAAAALRRAPQPGLSADQVEERLAVLEGRRGGACPIRRQSIRTDRSSAALPVARARSGRGGRRGRAIVVAGGGDGGGGSATATVSAGGREDVVPIRLTPVGGSEASGIDRGRPCGRPARCGSRHPWPAAERPGPVATCSGSSAPAAAACRSPSRRSVPTASSPAGRRSRRRPQGLLPSFDTAELTLTRQQEAAAAVRRRLSRTRCRSPSAPSSLRGACARALRALAEEQPVHAGSSLPGFMIPAGSSRSLTARSASMPSSPTSARM